MLRVESPLIISEVSREEHSDLGCLFTTSEIPWPLPMWLAPVPEMCTLVTQPEISSRNL